MALPKDLQSAYQRWEMTSFGDERPSVVAQRQAERAAFEAARAPIAPPPTPTPSMPMPTLEEIEAIREAARQEGYAEGLAAGHASGLAFKNESVSVCGKMQAPPV